MSWQLTFASNGLWSVSGLGAVCVVRSETTAKHRTDRIKTGRDAPHFVISNAVFDQ
jgi:hypothetical protein